MADSDTIDRAEVECEGERAAGPVRRADHAQSRTVLPPPQRIAVPQRIAQCVTVRAAAHVAMMHLCCRRDLPVLCDCPVAVCVRVTRVTEDFNFSAVQYGSQRGAVDGRPTSRAHIVDPLAMVRSPV